MYALKSTIMSPDNELLHYKFSPNNKVSGDNININKYMILDVANRHLSEMTFIDLIRIKFKNIRL